jgi:hypothetical protein
MQEFGVIRDQYLIVRVMQQKSHFRLRHMDHFFRYTYPNERRSALLIRINKMQKRRASLAANGALRYTWLRRRNTPDRASNEMSAN